LKQLGIDAAHLVSTTPGLVWITITGHGAADDAANWVGFGDDCGVAGGLSAALREATGDTGFVGDAIADPLTGIFAALTAWERWSAGHGGRYALAMSHVAAHCLAHEQTIDPIGFSKSLVTWRASVGKLFPVVASRSVTSVASFGEHTRSIRQRFGTC
jgi:hypothetical protein